PKYNFVLSRKRCRIAVEICVAVIGDLGGIDCFFRDRSVIGVVVSCIGNRRLVSGGGVNLVQRPMKRGAVTAPAWLGVGDPGAARLAETIDTAALVMDRPFVVCCVQNAAEKFGVHLGAIFVGCCRRHKFDFPSEQIKDESLVIFIL